MPAHNLTVQQLSKLQSASSQCVNQTPLDIGLLLVRADQLVAPVGERITLSTMSKSLPVTHRYVQPN
ncbi:hypothetical protein PtB15_2B594 [Puccinia triticina]|nr:hypothetical protein PtB15_2B594 [Puccinia triticina]